MKKYFLITILAGLAVSGLAYAAATSTITNPLTVDSLAGFVRLIAQFVFNLSVWVAPIMYIIAGFYYLTAAGEPEKIKTAKKVFIYTSIGLVIVFAAGGLIRLFEEVFVGTVTTP